MNPLKLKRIYAVENVNDFEIVFEFTDGSDKIMKVDKNSSKEDLLKFIDRISTDWFLVY